MPMSRTTRARWLGAAALALAGVASLSAQGRATRPQVVPPQGPVRQVVFKHCTNCHGIDDYAYNALDRARWDALLTAKHRGLDVPLPAESRAVLLDWLEVRFGPESKPFPRAYIAQGSRRSLPTPRRRPCSSAPAPRATVSSG